MQRTGVCDEEMFLRRLRQSEVFLRDRPIEETLAAFLRGIGISEERDVLNAVTLWKSMADDVYIYAGAETLLKAIKARGCRLSLLTNSDKHGCENSCIGALLEEFDYRYMSYQKGFAKPDQICWQAIRDHFDVQYPQMLMIGDSMSSDIIPALGLGMRAIHIKNGETEISRLAEELSSLPLQLSRLE
jgi:FMN phosphatase YigB (HAD superfamily)